MAEMDDAFCERLISVIQEYPSLYDKTHESYKDLSEKCNIWSEIGMRLDTEKDVVMRRWKGLRDCYSRKLREINSMKSGQAPKRIVPYKFQKQMNFLAPYLKNKNTTSNFGPSSAVSSAGSEMGSDSESVQPNSPTATCTSRDEPNNGQVVPPSSLGKRKQVERADPVADSIMEYIRERRESRVRVERDPDELWLLSLAPTLRRFSDYQKAQAKLQIQQLLLDIEFGQQPRIRHPQQSSSGENNYMYTYQNTYMEL